MKVAAYIRVSTEGQVGEDKFGLSAQREAIETYSINQGFEIVSWFEDLAISGATLTRPGLQFLLQQAEHHSFNAVIVAKMDRIARDLMAQLWIEKELLTYGIEIISTAEPFRGQDPANVLFRQIIGAFAQFEKARITERMTGGRKQKALSGGYAGGGPPIGYHAKKGSKTLDVDQDKTGTVQRVFELRASHPDFTLRELANQLNLEGHRTAHDKEFHAIQVKRILDRKDLYSGKYCYGGIQSPGQHQAII